jgi:Putative  PD-(D/E)XK family member, (DUF4420)
VSEGLKTVSRHLGIDGVKEYVELGVPGTLLVDGDPTGYLVIDPADKRLAIQVPAEGQLPNCARYENVDATRVRRDDADWNQLSVTAGDRLEDLYPFLCQVLDRVQLEGQPFSAAVLDVLRVYRNVLTPRSGLSEADQVGLFGELLVLQHLVATTGADSAMARWLGPSSEEHDFAFDDFDLEVKTTTGERRRHWISSLSQLTPTNEKRLFLISIQITGAGADGHSLPLLVDELVHALDQKAGEFTAELERGGYFSSESDLYPRHWTLRTQPASFAVDDYFPALHENTLGKLVADWGRIVDLRYELDLSGLPRTQISALGDFTGSEEERTA